VLTRTYGEIIRAVFHELGMPSLKVQYVCTEEEAVPAPAAVPVKQSKLDFESSDNQLQSRYTFDTFVVGKSNEFAHAASPPWPSNLRRHTTRCFCTAEWAWARRT